MPFVPSTMADMFLCGCLLDSAKASDPAVCLRLASAQWKSIVVVVAPLIALTVDQVQSLRAKDVNAVIVFFSRQEGRVSTDLLASEDTLGRDFRPAYSHLAELRAMVPSHTPVRW